MACLTHERKTAEQKLSATASFAIANAAYVGNQSTEMVIEANLAPLILVLHTFIGNYQSPCVHRNVELHSPINTLLTLCQL